MRSKIYFPEQTSETFEEVFASFIISQTSKGVAAVTIRNYHLHLRSISKHLDIGMPFCSLTKRHLESMVVSMRAAGLAHNTVATYLRVINTFLNWANREGLTSVSIPNIKEKDTVKETYTDAELLILLKKPEKKCDFTEYRNWVIINYLLNAGCRAATVRNIQNRDVDLENRQVVFRHNKNGKIQVSPLCSQMASILADYMAVRKGKPDDYLFCNQYGEMLTENALRLAVAHYWPKFNDMKVDFDEEVSLLGGKSKEVQVCPYVFYEMCINSNGTYSLCRFDWNHAMILDPHVSYPPTPKKIWDSITLWRFQEQFLKKERKMMTVLSCPKCGILKQGVPEDLDEFAEEILDEM